MDDHITADAEGRQVKRRKVFYIPGYDPIHPRRYRELYRTESAAQADISGYDIGIAPKQGKNYGWRVESRMDRKSVDSDVEVLVWSDIVRGRRLMWLRKGPVIAALYPVGMLLMQLLTAVLVGLLAAKLLGIVLTTGAQGIISLVGEGPEDIDYSILEAGRTVFKVVCFGLVAQTILRWFKKKDGKFFAYYPMHDYAEERPCTWVSKPRTSCR